MQFVILGSGTIINVSTSPGTPTVPLGTPLPWRYAMNVDSSRSILFVAGAISGSGGRCQIIVDGVVVTDEPAVNNAVACSWNAP